MSAYTRRELALLVGTTADGVRRWERLGLLSPQARSGSSNNPLPVRYSQTDATMARVLAQLTEARIEVSNHKDALSQLGKRLSRLPSPWSGWVVLAGDGALETITQSFEEVCNTVKQLELSIVLSVTKLPDEELMN